MDRLKRLATGCILAVMIAWFVGGAIRFPDPPMRPCGIGYCGKLGSFHTESDYRLYRIWSQILLLGWPTGMGALILLNWGKWKKDGRI
jgi:hypothetical protein